MTQVTVNPPSDVGPVHPLVARITRMRGRVRAVVAMFGLGVLITAAIGGIIVLMFGDYLLHFGTPVRLVLLFLWLGFLGILAWRVLISPLSTRLTDQFLASRVENLHKDLADELISAVHFIHAGTIRTNALAARHVDAAAAKTATIKFDEAVDFRRSTKAAGIAALVILAAAIIASTNPNAAKIALSRWFSANPMAWPHATTVEFAWPDGRQPAVIPIGEQFLVRAKVVRGGYPTQRVYLTFWGDNKSSHIEQMTLQPGMSTSHEFVYEYTLEPDGENSLSLRLQADDDREQGPVNLRLAARPVVRELNAQIAPPAYVKDVKDPTKPAAPMIVDLLSQAGRAVEGGTISLNVRSTKPFMLDASGRPQIRLLDQVKDVDVVQGMTRQLVAPDTAIITFPATKTLQARMSVRDTDGFENRAGGTLSVEVVPDGQPSVVITDPKRLSERVATGVVEIAVSATDDLGLDGLKLVAEKFDAKPGDAPAFEVPLEWAERTVDAAVGSTSGRAVYTWDLAPLKLQPGARLSFYAMVQDNYDVQGKRHPWVKSAPLTLQILSQKDMENLAREGLNRVKEQIKVLKASEETTKARTDVIQKAAADSGVTTVQQKAQLADLAQQQSQETSTGKNIEQKVNEIKDSLRQNKMADSDLGKLSDKVAEGMKDVSNTNMPKAASELGKAHDAAGNEPKPGDPKEGAKQEEKAKEESKEAANSAGKASKEQGEAIAKMDNMIAQLGAAGDLQAALSTARDIKERQDKLAEKTEKLAPSIAGKDPSQLPKDAKEALDKQAEEQKDLAQKTQDLIDQMKKSAEQQKQTDPAASESMAKSAKAGEKSDVPGAQGSASKSLSQAQTSKASSSQSQAQAGLQQMIDELTQNEKRELEQLQRQLAELIDEVKKLKANEEGLNTDTVAAGEKAIKDLMAKLGDRQGRLQMNTIVVQKKAESTKDTQKAAGDIRDAGEQMGSAAGPLYAAKQPSALEPETKAIASLDSAIKKLEEQKDKVDQQLKDKTLAEFIKQYEGIKLSEEGIKKFSDQVEAKRLASVDKQIDRISGMALGAQSKVQGELVDQVGKLSTDDKLKEFEVIVWMNSQISGAMDASKERLAKADTGVQLASAQQTSIDRLADVIQALKEEKQKDDEFKKDDGGGGGGGGGGGKKPLVPPIAQLKLIRAMQNVVNSQTVSVNKAILGAKTDAEKQELKQEAAKLGKTQGDLKGIVEKIMRDLQ